MVKARILVTWAVTFVIFSTEAFIHYSMGKGKWEFPETLEALKLLGLVLATSLISASLAQFIIQVTLPEPKKGPLIKKVEKKYDSISK